MIAVVADDFTGAAELAAVGLRYGLKAALLLRLLCVVYVGSDFFPAANLPPVWSGCACVGKKQRQYLTVKPGSYPWPEKI